MQHETHPVCKCWVHFVKDVPTFIIVCFCRSWYLSLDKAVMWLVCAIVKIWAPHNDLKNKTAFTNYGLIWLVLFYLMIKKVVPPLVDTIKNVNKNDRVIVEGMHTSKIYPIYFLLKYKISIIIGIYFLNMSNCINVL